MTVRCVVGRLGVFALTGLAALPSCASENFSGNSSGAPANSGKPARDDRDEAAGEAETERATDDSEQGGGLPAPDEPVAKVDPNEVTSSEYFLTDSLPAVRSCFEEINYGNLAKGEVTPMTEADFPHPEFPHEKMLFKFFPWEGQAVGKPIAMHGTKQNYENLAKGRLKLDLRAVPDGTYHLLICMGPENCDVSSAVIEDYLRNLRETPAGDDARGLGHPLLHSQFPVFPLNVVGGGFSLAVAGGKFRLARRPLDKNPDFRHFAVGVTVTRTPDADRCDIAEEGTLSALQITDPEFLAIFR